MEQREYKKKSDEIRSELKKLEKKQQDCISLKKTIIIEEERHDKELKKAYDNNIEMENDWKKRNMTANSKNLFQEQSEILNKIKSERSRFSEKGFDDLDRYMKKLSGQEEEYKQQLSDLKKEYENKKEDKNGKNN